MYRKLLLVLGPLIFLVAQLLAPGGSPDPAQRQALIANNQAAWELSHQIFAVAFAFLLCWLFDLWSRIKEDAPLLAGIGAFFTGFALLADFGVATLQFVALEAVRALSSDQALTMINAMSNSRNLLTFVYLPYLGFVIGLGVLGWADYRKRRQTISALLLALTGILLVAGGMMGNQIALIGAGAVWVSFTLLYPNATSLPV